MIKQADDLKSWLGIKMNTNQGCGSGSGSGNGGSRFFSVEAEARKFHRFRFHIGWKNRGRKEIGSVILRRRANRGSVNINK